MEYMYLKFNDHHKGLAKSDSQPLAISTISKEVNIHFGCGGADAIRELEVSKLGGYSQTFRLPN